MFQRCNTFCNTHPLEIAGQSRLLQMLQIFSASQCARGCARARAFKRERENPATLQQTYII
jgi:hypothetical protein